MTPRERRTAVLDGIAAMFAGSGYTATRKGDAISVITGHTAQVVVLIGNYFRTVDALAQAVAEARSTDAVPMVVFDADGKTARMPVPRVHKRRSLKHYSWQDRTRMVELRDVEARAMREGWGPRDHLNYVQMDWYGTIFTEVVRMDPVLLDYSHQDPGDPSCPFAENGESKAFKLATTILTVIERVEVAVTNESTGPIARLCAAPPPLVPGEPKIPTQTW